MTPSNEGEWEIDLFFDLVTHRPTKVTFAIEVRLANAMPSDCTPLYTGDVLPEAQLSELRACAVNLWNRAKFGRAAA